MSFVWTPPVFSLEKSVWAGVWGRHYIVDCKTREGHRFLRGWRPWLNVPCGLEELACQAELTDVATAVWRWQYVRGSLQKYGRPHSTGELTDMPKDINSMCIAFSFFLQNVKFKDVPLLNKERSHQNRQRNEGKIPCIIDLRTRWTWVICFTVRLFCPGEWTRFCSDRTCVLLRARLNAVKKRTNIFCPELLIPQASSP